jgi:hypothetical protein
MFVGLPSTRMPCPAHCIDLAVHKRRRVCDLIAHRCFDRGQNKKEKAGIAFSNVVKMPHTPKRPRSAFYKTSFFAYQYAGFMHPKPGKDFWHSRAFT